MSCKDELNETSVMDVDKEVNDEGSVHHEPARCSATACDVISEKVIDEVVSCRTNLKISELQVVEEISARGVAAWVIDGVIVSVLRRFKSNVDSFTGDVITETDIKVKKSKKKKMPTEKRPNWFIAFQIKNKDILSKFSTVQEYITDKEPGLKSWCVPVEKSHLTLVVFHATEEQLSQVETSIGKAIKDFNETCQDSLDVQVKGLGTFKGQVLFAKLNFARESCEESFTLLWTKIADQLLKSGFITERDADMANFKHHVTLLKSSRARKQKRSKEKIPKKVEPELYSSLLNENFGPETFITVQLLSMTEPADLETGYYFCQKEFPLTSGSNPESPSEATKKVQKLDVADLSAQKLKIRAAIREAVESSVSKADETQTN